MTRLVNINDDRVKRDPSASSSKVTVACCVCGKMGATLADLDGEPFAAYYHAACLPPDEDESDPHRR